MARIDSLQNQRLLNEQVLVREDDSRVATSAVREKLQRIVSTREANRDAVYFNPRRDDLEARQVYSRRGQIEVARARREELAAGNSLPGHFLENPQSPGSGELFFENGLKGAFKANRDGTYNIGVDGGFMGIVNTASKGVVYNPDTKQAFAFDVKINGSAFSFSNIKEVAYERAHNMVAPYIEEV